MSNENLIEQILQKLNVDGKAVVKYAWGHLPTYTYEAILRRILDSEGKLPVESIFSEMSKPTSRAMLKKAFNVSSLHGGHSWYAYTLSLINKRKCTACSAVKDTSNFYKEPRAWSYDGCRSICISCDSGQKKEHRQANLEQYAYTSSKYRAKKLRALPAWANLAEIKEIYSRCPEGYEVDHIVPIQGDLVSGLHCESNLQYLPVSLNRGKSNRFDPETYEHNIEYIAPYK